MGMAGGDYQGQRNSIGSYGFALFNLAQGLMISVEKEWISQEEARVEFRKHVGTIQQAEKREKQVAALRKEADELEEEEM